MDPFDCYEDVVDYRSGIILEGLTGVSTEKTEILLKNLVLKLDPNA